MLWCWIGIDVQFHPLQSKISCIILFLWRFPVLYISDNLRNDPLSRFMWDSPDLKQSERQIPIPIEISKVPWNPDFLKISHILWQLTPNFQPEFKIHAAYLHQPIRNWDKQSSLLFIHVKFVWTRCNYLSMVFNLCWDVYRLYCHEFRVLSKYRIYSPICKSAYKAVMYILWTFWRNLPLTQL
jgi:hypothetical protein